MGWYPCGGCYDEGCAGELAAFSCFFSDGGIPSFKLTLAGIGNPAAGCDGYSREYQFYAANAAVTDESSSETIDCDDPFKYRFSYNLSAIGLAIGDPDDEGLEVEFAYQPFVGDYDLTAILSVDDGVNSLLYTWRKTWSSQPEQSDMDSLSLASSLNIGSLCSHTPASAAIDRC